MNHITIYGHIGTDVELTQVNAANGPRAMAKFRLASNRPRRGGQDQPTDWFSITCFGPLAETVAQHKVKGDPVIVLGSIAINVVPARDDPERKLTFVDVTATDVTFLPKAGSGSNQGIGSDVTPAAEQREAVPSPF